jgi:hypothetical protein
MAWVKAATRLLLSHLLLSSCLLLLSRLLLLLLLLLSRLLLLLAALQKHVRIGIHHASCCVGGMRAPAASGRH